VETLNRRLFAATPAVLPLFGGTDLSRQKAKLPATLVLLRKSLRSLDALVPELRELGARHGAYGAQADHYAVVGANLIASMAELAATPGDRSMSAPGPTPSRSWRGHARRRGRRRR
jgi:hemoglobin-like flavoprotein